MHKPSEENEYVNRSRPLREDMALQRRLWQFERAGWVLFGVLVLLSMLGLFSQGPLSAAVARTADGQVSVDYQRFVRNGLETQLLLQVPVDAAGHASIRLNAVLLDSFTVVGIQPRPDSSSSLDGGLLLDFRAEPGKPAKVYLGLRPEGYGMVHLEVAANAGEPIRFRQFIYP